MFSFIAKLFTGGLGAVVNYAIVIGLVVSLLGFGYWQFTSNIAERAKLQFQVTQLEESLKDKNETIELLEYTVKLNNTIIQENEIIIDKFKLTNSAIQSTLIEREDANNGSSEFLKEYFRMKARSK